MYVIRSQVGLYLAVFTPHTSNYHAEWTHDKAQAMTFRNAANAEFIADKLIGARVEVFTPENFGISIDI